ncbi:MAG: M23 family metallopeptidase [Novosphingobium sp.]
MKAGLTNAVKMVAAAITIALSLWLVQVDRGVPGGPQGAATQAAGPAPATAKLSASPPVTACDALGSMAIPVKGVRPEQLTDTFNDARSEGRNHDALDIMAPLDTPVVAAAAGRVEKLFLSDAGGITAFVRSPGGDVIYYYAHLNRYAPGLTEGAALARGDAIGNVGFTGNANPTAPHLHFAILATMPDKKWWEAKQALNPYPMLAGKADQFLGGCRR